jgi:hypothetical protein
MWTPASRIPVSARPTTVTTADLNGDGEPDLLVANGQQTDVFLGKGDGTFEAVQVVSPGTAAYNKPTDIGVADFDGDGKLDLALGAPEPTAPGTITVLYGYGDGTFDPNGQSLHLPTSSPYLSGLRAADINHDGKPDIVVGEPFLPGFDVYLNTGSRTFSAANVVQSGPSGGAQAPISVLVADVDGDGKPDLLLGNDSSVNYVDGPSTVEIWLGHGDGTFTSSVSYPVGIAEYDVVAADLNGDGKLDLATADQTSASVLLGHGDGTFVPDTRLVSYGHPSRIVATDVSGDGIVDLVISGEPPEGGSFSLLEVRIGVGDGSFYPADAYEGGSATVAVADVNGDGRMDLLAGDTETSEVIVYLGSKHPECK